MRTVELTGTVVEQKAIISKFLERTVIVDLYLPRERASYSDMSLLLINDGQDLTKMNFASILDQLQVSNSIQPLLCVGIHAGRDRKSEYGTALILDFEGRGAKAGAYTRFVLYELLPLIYQQFGVETFKKTGFAGFSLGGLMALDIVWRFPRIFSIAGVFSGSLWWRTKSLEDDYNDATDRIMHHQIREGEFHPGLSFYFTTGSLDETADRNNNGVIDSIDDTLDLIAELKAKGYTEGHEIAYVNYEDGRHDVATWGRGMPEFLLWGWGRTIVNSH
jgi:enterochelin esterase-like enzyme